jgi:hypothetical protein
MAGYNLTTFLLSIERLDHFGLGISTSEYINIRFVRLAAQLSSIMAVLDTLPTGREDPRIDNLRDLCENIELLMMSHADISVYVGAHFSYRLR